jgi:ParB family chromosome partitioning protein
MKIPIDSILPNPEQPRAEFDEQELAGLADSIRANGLINPIAVEQAGDGYILIDGERRWRAAKIAGLGEIEAHVQPPLNGGGNLGRLMLALVANVQRADLNPIEEARAYRRLRDDFSLSIRAISKRTGVYEARIINRLHLLDLDAEIQELAERRKFFADGRIVDALMKIPDREARVALARRASERGYSVRTILTAAAQLRSALKAKVSADEIPALKFGRRGAADVDQPKWDALAQIGGAPPWPLVEESARWTCDGCTLRSMASRETCGGCPLPVALAEMIRRAMGISQAGQRSKAGTRGGDE